MSADIKQMIEVVDKMEKVPNFLDGRDPYEIFLRPENTFFLVDDVGIMAVVDPQPQRCAHAHITFWDGRLRGREAMCAELADFVIRAAGYRYLFTGIPERAVKIIKFAERVGFKRIFSESGMAAMHYVRRI